MKLLTKKLAAALPPLYATENLPASETMVCGKFFTPDSNWTWLPIEFDGEDIFYGLVVGFETEFGYFSLSELKAARGPWGLPIERDKWFEPALLTDLRECPAWLKEQEP